MARCTLRMVGRTSKRGSMVNVPSVRGKMDFTTVLGNVPTSRIAGRMFLHLSLLWFLICLGACRVMDGPSCCLNGKSLSIGCWRTVDFL